LPVAPALKEGLDPFISLLLDLLMVQSNINVHASDMRAGVMGQQDLRNPAAYKNNIIFVSAQKMDQLYKDRTCSLDSFGCVIPSSYHIIVSLLTILV
jgi:hypothetical protein